MGRTSRMVLSSLMILTLAGTLVGCGADKGNDGKVGTGVYSTSKTVNDVLDEQAGKAPDSTDTSSVNTEDAADTADIADQAAADNNTESTEENKESDTASVDVSKISVNKGDSVDVDLTALSSTMVYSEVYNMVSEPSDYMGKTVRMEGTLAVYHDDVDNNDYYACVVKDATACCAQGIEFVLKDGDYPEANTDVQVVGVFSSYKIEDYEYFTLVNAVME